MPDQLFDINKYFDYAATTPVDSRVLTVMNQYFSDNFYNPSASYLAARNLKSTVAGCRDRIAATLGCKPSEIYFVASCTEANNLVIKGLLQDGDQLLISAIEHDAIDQPAKSYKAISVAVDAIGHIDIDQLFSHIGPKTKLISVMYANNETGAIQPIRQIALRLKELNKSRPKAQKIYFHTDAAQAANLLNLDVDNLGVDMMSLSPHKFYGPKGLGILYVSKDVKLHPLIEGGGQERGLRSSTENVAAIVGSTEALCYSQNQVKNETQRLQLIKNTIVSKLLASITDVEVNGSLKNSLASCLSIYIPGVDNERLIYLLECDGYMISAGSACSASSSLPSRTLQAIGRTEQQASQSIRVSLGRNSTLFFAEMLCDSIVKATRKIKSIK
jgi:cysteine desulfurase